uniref:Ig-like domain-containing protein n=1 Tax=Calidris pygmaea TaxID=425635 RepID=A0A8C3J7R4_9CHAR
SSHSLCHNTTLGHCAGSHAQKDSVLQFPPEMTIQAGHNATLHCNFSTTDSNPYIFWYQQHQSQSPQRLLWVYKAKPQVDSGRFFSAMSVATSQVVLHVRDAELQDSAAYFCALTVPSLPLLAWSSELKSQNHRILVVGRDLRDHRGQPHKKKNNKKTKKTPPKNPQKTTPTNTTKNTTHQLNPTPMTPPTTPHHKLIILGTRACPEEPCLHVS